VQSEHPLDNYFRELMRRRRRELLRKKKAALKTLQVRLKGMDSLCCWCAEEEGAAREEEAALKTLQVRVPASTGLNAAG
jgi:hypothetical protein